MTFRNRSGAACRIALILLCALTSFAGANAASSDPDALSEAYRKLRARGLLPAEVARVAPTPPGDAQPIDTSSNAAQIVVASMGSSRAEETPSTRSIVQTVTASRTRDVALSETRVEPRAYQVLRSLGLLTVEQPVTVRAPGRLQADRVLVKKAERKLYLLHNGHAFREFDIWLGRRPVGAKRQAGDLRTPEGVYTLDWRNPGSRYHKAIHISYPNAVDVERARRRGVDPGGMIMIHGEHYIPAFRQLYRRAAKADWTDGCIALRNEQMDELWQLVGDGIPIEIHP